MMPIYLVTTRIFDPLHYYWELDKTQRFVAGLLVVLYVLSFSIIEIKRQGFLSGPSFSFIPTSHYMAINLAFTLVLILEVVSLIFVLPCSISKAIGKQFEILALIFLRSAFKALTEFPEPISINGHHQDLYVLLADGGGAIIVFALLGVYTYLRRNLDETHISGQALLKFVAAKKLVALCMLILFVGMGIKNGLSLLHGHKPFHFFQSFYTILIFSDILLVLIAQRFQPKFHAVFRNSGYALATLLFRLALTAPPYYNVSIGIVSCLFACLLTYICNLFYSQK